MLFFAYFFKLLLIQLCCYSQSLYIKQNDFNISQILQGGGGPVTVNASLSNVTVVGFGNTKIVHNSVDPKTFDFYTKLHLPRLRIDGNYDLLGRILVIPLKGRGTCWFDASKYGLCVIFFTLPCQDNIFFFVNSNLHCHCQKKLIKV